MLSAISYIRDEVLGPIVMCVGSFLPFQTTLAFSRQQSAISQGALADR